jgi:hypothetical protein
MNKLLDILLKANRETAVLEDIKTLRKVVQSENELLYQPSENGTVPLLLAKQKGVKRFEVAIARQVNYQAYYSQEELKRLLVDYISELSEEYWCAGWYADIEYELWEILDLSIEEMEPFWQRRVEPQDLSDLKWLSQVTSSWGKWDDEREDIPVSLEEWKKNYQQWKERLNWKNKEE